MNYSGKVGQIIENYLSSSSENYYDVCIDNSTMCMEHSRSLWRGVILQAILDASSLAKRTENVIEKRRAFLWLTTMSNDFQNVCSMAGYSPYYVKKKAMLFLKKK